MKVKIRLFGEFRDYDQSGELVIELREGATAAELRVALGLRFENPGLLADSALADERALLTENQLLRDLSTLALLPPVCGG